MYIKVQAKVGCFVLSSVNVLKAFLFSCQLLKT